MSTALQIIQMVFQSVAILFMITFMIIGIWAFIIFIKMFKNQKENNSILKRISSNISELNTSSKGRNQLLEKISTCLSLLSNSNSKES